jgi:Protein of unknown function (DUF2510)
VTDPSRHFSVRLAKHTGAVILWHHQRYTVTGTLEQCEEAYRSAQLHNMLAGWWSLVSVVVMNWVALISNFSAIRQVRKAAAQPWAAQQAAAQPWAGQQAAAQPWAAQQAAAQPWTAHPPAAVGPPPGWYPDPSGPGQRYWDGAGWTQWAR